jgi:SAM-dependent methyltransferase
MSEEKKDDGEREVWEFMTPLAWHNSVAGKDSIFNDTYRHTREQIEETARVGGYDVIIEVGCGTGDVIGDVKAAVPRYGLDINVDFIKFCDKYYSKDNCEFQVADALNLTDWWKQFNGKFKKPLVTCVNNTLNIMPEHLRGGVVDQMIAIAGDDGLCLATYWNGSFFSHAIMNYYKKNEALCGKFEFSNVNWEARQLVTPTNYSTEWHYPAEVQQLLRAYDIDVPNLEPKLTPGVSHVNTQGLAIFIWFDKASTSRAKGYYDSDDAQKFYNNIWGEETIHLGRYDLLTEDDKKQPMATQVGKAQALHEEHFIKLIKAKTSDQSQPQLRIVDLGCGYGGLLRRLCDNDMVWSGVGCDISGKMCAQARRLNAEQRVEKVLTILEESYLDVSVPAESADMVISMDALLHVGPDRQRRAIQEAARILRPGGWIIFTDIMQQEDVDAVEMQPIYDRINLSKMGTVSNYKSALEEVGFTHFEHTPHSANVASHYGSVLKVLQAKGDSLGISPEYRQSMEKGLTTWCELAPKNIVWGFVCAQKTKKVDLSTL